jgi:outer membrane receptor protein involved in Fe transport
VRSQSKLTRVATALLDTPFPIAQDQLALNGFTVQRLGWGVNLTPRRDRLSLTFAIENLANKYYREQYQFAPARGRTFTLGLSVGVF